MIVHVGGEHLDTGRGLRRGNLFGEHDGNGVGFLARRAAGDPYANRDVRVTTFHESGQDFVGQFIEGNILQPRLVGKSVGLHPVWLMFALFAFGALFGFVGLLVAVPAAAAIAVLVRFAISRYLDSPLYHGHSDHDRRKAAKSDPEP